MWKEGGETYKSREKGAKGTKIEIFSTKTHEEERKNEGTGTSLREKDKHSLTAIPRWKYAIPSDLASQATLGPVSTWIGDGLGIPGVVSFFLLFSILFHFF